MAGKDRTGEGAASGLITEYVRILDDLRRHRTVKFIVENVPSDKRADAHCNAVLNSYPVKVNAAAFGAQYRRRLFWSNFGIMPPDTWSDEVFRDIAERDPRGSDTSISSGTPERLTLISPIASA